MESTTTAAIEAVKASITKYHQDHPRQRTYDATEAPYDRTVTGRRRRLYWRMNDDGSATLTLFRTEIVSIHPDGTVELDTGGWHTASTREAMNYVLHGLGLTVFMRRGHLHATGLGVGQDVPLGWERTVLPVIRPSTAA